MLSIHLGAIKNSLNGKITMGKFNVVVIMEVFDETDEKGMFGKVFDGSVFITNTEQFIRQSEILLTF